LDDPAEGGRKLLRIVGNYLKYGKPIGKSEILLRAAQSNESKIINFVSNVINFMMLN
jgi:hypothetical protein